MMHDMLIKYKALLLVSKLILKNQHLYVKISGVYLSKCQKSYVKKSKIC